MDKKTEFQLLNAKDGGVAFAFMVTLYVFISFFGQAILLALVSVGSVAYFAFSSLFSLTAMVLVILYYTLYKKTGVFQSLSVSKFNPSALVLVLLLSIGMFFGLGFVNDAFAGIFKSLGLNVSGPILPLNNFFEFILFSFTLALLPAVIEELFFRGLILNSLKKANQVLAVITVATLFALYHCSIAQFIYQLIYGAALTVLAMYSKSVFPGIIVHFINNFAVICFEYFKISVNLYNPFVIIAGGASLVIFAVIIVLGLKNKGQNSQVVKGEIKRFWLPFALFGAVVCLALLVSNLFVG